MKWRQLTKSLLSNLILIAVVVVGVHFWQTRDMLDSGEPMDNFRLPLLSGGLADTLSQDKPTLLYVMAPWCKICELTASKVEDLYQSQGNDVNVVMLAQSYQAPEAVQQFVDQQALTLPVLLGNAHTQSRLNIRAFPSYYLVSRNGQIRYRSVGYTSGWGLRARLWWMQFNEEKNGA